MSKKQPSVLILTRKLGETIVIGDDIEVTLVQIQLNQHQVRLGIAAPRNVGVYRKELLQAIRRENQRAASAQTIDSIPDNFDLPVTPAAMKSPDAVPSEE